MLVLYVFFVRRAIFLEARERRYAGGEALGTYCIEIDGDDAALDASDDSPAEAAVGDVFADGVLGGAADGGVFCGDGAGAVTAGGGALYVGQSYEFWWDGLEEGAGEMLGGRAVEVAGAGVGEYEVVFCSG